MDFVIVSKPGQRVSAKTTRRAHSHAARVAHARARKQRMVEYVKDKALSHHHRPDSVPQIDNPKTRNVEATLTRNSIPDTPAGNFECDQIIHFRQLLSPRERFIFNHCKYFQPSVQGSLAFQFQDRVTISSFRTNRCRHSSCLAFSDQ